MLEWWEMEGWRGWLWNILRQIVEFQWFLMALSVRPGRNLEINAHLLPNLNKSTVTFGGIKLWFDLLAQSISVSLFQGLNDCAIFLCTVFPLFPASVWRLRSSSLLHYDSLTTLVLHLLPLTKLEAQLPKTLSFLLLSGSFNHFDLVGIRFSLWIPSWQFSYLLSCWNNSRLFPSLAFGCWLCWKQGINYFGLPGFPIDC